MIFSKDELFPTLVLDHLLHWRFIFLSSWFLFLRLFHSFRIKLKLQVFSYCIAYCKSNELAKNFMICNNFYGILDNIFRPQPALIIMTSSSSLLRLGLTIPSSLFWNMMFPKLFLVIRKIDGRSTWLPKYCLFPSIKLFTLPKGYFEIEML